jgi:hypothetical protein
LRIEREAKMSRLDMEALGRAVGLPTEKMLFDLGKRLKDSEADMGIGKLSDGNELLNQYDETRRQRESQERSPFAVDQSPPDKIDKLVEGKRRPMTEAEERLVQRALEVENESFAGAESEMACRWLNSINEKASRVRKERAPKPTLEEVKQKQEAAMVARRAWRAAAIALTGEDPDPIPGHIKTPEELAVIEAAKAALGSITFRVQLIRGAGVLAAPPELVDSLVDAVRRLK